MTELKGKSKASTSLLEKELENADKQFKEFDDNVKSLTLDRMNEAPKKEVEPQTKLSQSEIEKSKNIYLKPIKTVSSRDKFNERLRDKYNFQKEYVQFIAEHKEIIGETIEIWTRPFGGMSAEFWNVPTNKPVWGPRYLAEQIKKANYHRLTMQQNVITESGGYGQMYGALAVDTTVQRLDAIPVSSKKSIFMGANNLS